MTLQEYFGNSKGSFPKPGVVGVESDWMDAGPLEVPHGKLYAGDPHLMDEQLGSTVKVPKGTYRIQIKGMDFKGHRRTSRVRACLESVSEPTLGPQRGQTGTDSAWIGLCDYIAFGKAALPKHLEEYDQDISQITQQDGVGVITFELGGRKFEMHLQPSGLGDGTFAVFPLLSKGKTVGMEVEFLPPGFKLAHDIPSIGLPPKRGSKKRSSRSPTGKGRRKPRR